MDVTITNAATATSEEMPIELVRMLIAFGTAARVSEQQYWGSSNDERRKSIYLVGRWKLQHCLVCPRKAMDTTIPQFNGEMAMTTKAEKKVTMALFTYCMYWPT